MVGSKVSTNLEFHETPTMTWPVNWKRQGLRLQSQSPNLGHRCHQLGMLAQHAWDTHLEQCDHWRSPATPCTSLAVATFAGYSPARAGEPPMTHPAQLEIPFMKNPPVRVLDERTGGVRSVSPTRQLHPNTGTAAFSPLGYMVLKGTTDYRRLYP